MTPEIHRAGWIMADPRTWIENGAVGLIGGRVAFLKKASPHMRAVDHGPGVILPALCNAHTHLSLSFLKGAVETENGFVPWVERLISCRESLGPETAAGAALAAAARMKAAGVGAAAEVGPADPGGSAMRRAGIEGTVFLESLGAETFPPVLPPDEKGIRFSWAGHGPHTTAPAALQALKAAARRTGRPFTLHLAESREETAFLATGTGPWADLMARRGHEVSQWRPWGERPVERALRLGLLDPGTLAVHLLEVTAGDIDILARTGTGVCLCPRSNLALHRKLPDIARFIAAGLRPALGTDSLAGTESLSLFDELRFVSDRYPALGPGTLLSMATINGARVLGLPEQGMIRPGHRVRMIYTALRAPNQRKAAEILVSGPHPKVVWL
ncbi:MAG: amidohydrolase [Deltaproteobacteria bacterium]|nr:MAG: amidohydrolase [Deltaproteobacteria bacterium]